MTVRIMEMTAINGGSGMGYVSFSVYKSGTNDETDRLAVVSLDDFDFSANAGKWFSGWRVTGRNLDFTNTLAWSAQGTFKRFTNSLYFYSDDSRKPNAQLADFVLYLAPAFPQDVLNNWSGIGKITNPRNPSWCGLALEWKRSDSGPPPQEDE